MTRRTAALTILAMLVAGVAYALVLYPQLPERIPTHWGADGQVDGWGHKSWAAFAGLGVTALFLGMLYLLPWLSPKGYELEGFAPTFHWTMVMGAGLGTYIEVVSLQAALHPQMQTGRWLICGIFVFLALLGNLLGKVRRNFWVGIRTPWALADEGVWIATHRLAARLLFATGLLGAVAVALGAPPEACLAGLLLALAVPAVYSLVLSKRRERGGSA
jgi:uncharacterized membrane protein